jgi:thioredoxin 1
MAAANIVTVTGQNFATEVLESSVPVLVDFWAEWCGPCRQIAPVLDELATEYNGRFKIAKVDVGEHQDLANQFDVQAIPTLLVFKGGQRIDQVIGLKSKRDLKAVFDRALAA